MDASTSAVYAVLRGKKHRQRSQSNCNNEPKHFDNNFWTGTG